MKFTFEQVGEALSAKLKESGLTLHPKTMAQVEPLLKLSSEDEELDSFIGKISPIVVGMAKEKNHQIAEELRNKKSPVQDPAPDPKEDEQNIADVVSKAVTAALAGVKEEINTIKESYSKDKQSQEAEARRSVFIAKAVAEGYSEGLVELSCESIDFSSEEVDGAWMGKVAANASRLGHTPNKPNAEPQPKKIDTSGAKAKLEKEFGEKK